MKHSIIGFKIPSADLHKKSPRIFAICLIIAAITTFVLLIAPLPEQEAVETKYTPPPVVIQLQNIPKIRHTVRTPAPPKPFITPGLPVEVDDEIMPDDITIEDTSLDLEASPETPQVVMVPDTGAGEEEDEIFEYYAVEEQPERINNVMPVYPPMAERANIHGMVTLRVLVNKEGAVDSVKVEKGPKIFHQSAIDAATATKFKPAKQNDRTVACWVIMPFRFVIQE